VDAKSCLVDEAFDPMFKPADLDFKLCFETAVHILQLIAYTLLSPRGKQGRKPFSRLQHLASTNQKALKA